MGLLWWICMRIRVHVYELLMKRGDATTPLRSAASVQSINRVSMGCVW